MSDGARKIIDAAGAFGRNVADKGRAAWGETPFYQMQLNGPAPDRIAYRPKEFRRTSAATGASIADGRFEYRGAVFDLEGAPLDSIWDEVEAGEALHEALHGFYWLRHLAALGQSGGRPASLLVAGWLARYSKWNADGWAPAPTAERLTALAAYSKLLFDEGDVTWRSRLLTSMARQLRHLSRTAHTAPEGRDRLATAAGLATAAACLPNADAALERGLEQLRREIRVQIRADGGHISRNPSLQFDILLRLLGLTDALAARRRTAPGFLRHAIDKMTPMTRYFLHGDGGLALFHGSEEDDAEALAAALARDDVHAKPFGFAPHTAYQRAAAGKSLLIMDVGRPAPPPFQDAAHDSALSFELSQRRARIIVNCGAGTGLDDAWTEAMRGADAHSAPIVWGEGDEELRPWHAFEIASRRFEDDDGVWVEALRAGVPGAPQGRVQRRVFMSRAGDDIRGEDRIWREGYGAPLSFHIRFHIHPALRASLARDRKSVLIIGTGGEGWRFRTNWLDLRLEKSVYVNGGNVPKPCEQIVLSSKAQRQDGEGPNDATVVKWAFQQINRSRSKTGRTTS